MTSKFAPLPLFDEPQPCQTDIYKRRMVSNVILQANVDHFRKDFHEWLEKNWAIWEAFEAQADRTWNRGRRHYSARTIIEWIRHETSMRESPNEHGFKINDHYTPDLARLWVLIHPDRDGFFERRVSPLSMRSV